jgi:hypothetical protein
LTALIWDAKPWLAKATEPLDGGAAPNWATCWRDLASPKSAEVLSAIAKLVHAPKEAVALFAQKLQPASPEEVALIRALVAELDSNKFAVREKASAELTQLGDFASAALEKVLDGNPALEVRQRVANLLKRLATQPMTAACLQQSRALMVLEMIASPEGTALVERLANGAPDAWLTSQARASRQRLPD